MKRSSLDLIVTATAGALAVLLFVGWGFTSSSLTVEMRVPAMDASPQSLDQADTTPRIAPIAGSPAQGHAVASVTPGVWPGFRGPNRDGISPETTRLSRQWFSGESTSTPTESAATLGPRHRWQISLCEGYAGAAIANGRVYVLDYDESTGRDVLRCLSLDDGGEIWSNGYPVAVTRNHGITRTVPVLHEDSVITFGPQCHVACWDASSGENRWLLDLSLQYDSVVPTWYAGQCPIIDDGRLILAVGGKALMIAVDPKSGDVVWQSPNPRQWQMTHGSIAVMQHAGNRTYVYCGSGGVVGIDAHDGTIRWDTTRWPVQFAHAPSPVVLPEGRVLVCSGYGNDIGALLLKVNDSGDSVSVEKQLSPKQFNSEQQTPILFQGHLYGVRKRGGGQMVCMDLQGNEVWNSGRDRFGHGPYLIADGLLFVLNNSGKLTIAEANASGYRRIGSYQAIEDAHDAWGPMAIVDGNLILRDMTRMVCLDVKELTDPNSKEATP